MTFGPSFETKARQFFSNKMRLEDEVKASLQQCCLQKVLSGLDKFKGLVQNSRSFRFYSLTPDQILHLRRRLLIGRQAESSFFPNRFEFKIRQTLSQWTLHTNSVSSRDSCWAELVKSIKNRKGRGPKSSGPPRQKEKLTGRKTGTLKSLTPFIGETTDGPVWLRESEQKRNKTKWELQVRPDDTVTGRRKHETTVQRDEREREIKRTRRQHLLRARAGVTTAAGRRNMHVMRIVCCRFVFLLHTRERTEAHVERTCFPLKVWHGNRRWKRS